METMKSIEINDNQMIEKTKCFSNKTKLNSNETSLESRLSIGLCLSVQSNTASIFGAKFQNRNKAFICRLT